MVFSWKKFFIIPIFTLFLIPLFYAHAQTDTTSLNSDQVNQDAPVPEDLSNSGTGYQTGPVDTDIDLTQTPENPGPFQNVSLHISSNLVDLNRYNENWFVDGKSVQSGIGQRDLTVQTKGYGETTSIVITIALPDTTIQKKITIEPQDLTLLWEANDAYVPPFYKGKKLPSREGAIKVVAIPNFLATQNQFFDPASGVYTWQRNGSVVAGSSGYGKDYFLFQNNRTRSSEMIGVTASDTADTNQATQSITIPIFNPHILFYVRDSKTGLRDPLAKTSIYFNGDKETIEAEPYYYSVINNNPSSSTDASYHWTMNDQPVSIGDNSKQNILDLTNPGGSGVASLNLSIDSQTHLFQQAQNTLNIIFNKK